ncbi:MAG: glycosyltransferase [Actinomycetota bacterium]|nr:glycosyltransferase [Actinomycetota bacterium]
MIQPAGFAAIPAGVSPMVVEDETMRRPEVAALGPDDVWAFGAHMFAGVAGPAKVADLVTIISSWKPALVVHDAIDFAAPVAAAHFGLPWVGHSFGALQPMEFWDLAEELVAPTWRQWAPAVDPSNAMFRYLYLDVCPPSFQSAGIGAVAVVQPMRWAPFDGGEGQQLPAWVSALPRLPIVYVTMGTIFNSTPGVFEVLLEGLADAPCSVIVTVGRDRDPAELGRPASNIRIEQWVPQSLLFAHCDLVVCHGGSGTTLGALAHGLPLLVIPQGANQYWNAERCVEIGAGRQLRGEYSPHDVRRDVDDLLAQPGFRVSAGRVRAEIERMPPPVAVIDVLERLARQGRPITTSTPE